MIIPLKHFPGNFDAFTIYPFIFIRERCKDDKGLIAHEEVHLHRQGMLGLIWWIRYILSPKFRLQEEILAYKVSIYHGMPVEVAANWLTKYGLHISRQEAINLLSRN